MIRGGIESLRGRRVLLLQGPVGPFFWRLARALESVGAEVSKVNFNAGDWLYFPWKARHFRQPESEWPRWLERVLETEKIDLILMFGDCRPLHVEARRIASRRRIEVGVFEEGYVRPNYVTLERHGVNGYSLLRQALDLAGTTPPPAAERQVGSTFAPMAWQALGYGIAHCAGKIFFPHYRHHRPMGLWEALRWVRSAWRKVYWHRKEMDVARRLQRGDAGRFFLVPLQVFNDAQVTVHGPVRSVPSFIRQVADSFAAHAPKDAQLVFKHHPMDRGHTDYSELIRRISESLGIAARVLYVHDVHLPTLLQRAEGVVVINSTVGLSALGHGAATLAIGSAIYDLPGLTFQGSLDDFWKAAPGTRPDKELVRRFREVLIARTQLNGSFYRALPGQEAHAGLVWPSPSRPVTRPPLSGRRQPGAALTTRSEGATS